MNKETFKKLEDGDRIRNRSSGNVYVVIATKITETEVVCIRTVTATNPDEWELVSKVKHID